MSTVHLKVPEGVYPRILERMQAAKRDIDLVAGPNPIEPRIARAKENIRLAVLGLLIFGLMQVFNYAVYSQMMKSLAWHGHFGRGDLGDMQPLLLKEFILGTAFFGWEATDGRKCQMESCRASS